MVTMTCCDSTYATVLDTVGHKCAVIRPALTTKALMTLCVVSAFMWAIIGGFVGMFLVSQPEESALFNCHIAGNKTCGATAPWHGFTNLFNNYAE